MNSGNYATRYHIYSIFIELQHHRAMKKETPDSETDYYRDNALTGHSEDEFQHAHYVCVLKDILLKSQTPINVGLYGRWGVGKSSIVHMLHEEIERKDELKDFKYVEVDAWGISGKSVRQGILEEINEGLGCPYPPEELEDMLYNVRHVETNRLKKFYRDHWWKISIGIVPLSVGLFIKLFAVSDYALSVLSAIGFAAIPAILVALPKLLSTTSKKTVPSVVSTSQFNKIYNAIIKKQEQKLVVVIDNLDRCEDTVAVELLGIIQTFMVRKNCINILACDDEALVRHLKSAKSNYTDKDGNEFLSKFFQVTIRIPPFIGENLSTYADKLIRKRDVPFSPFVKVVLISGAVENPRKINQFLNIAVALYRLAKLKEDAGRLPKDAITGHTHFLMKTIIIRHEWPGFFRALENLPNLLTDMLKKNREWLNGQIPELTISKEEFDRLQKFLNATKLSNVKDITPFLRLNQESYAAEPDIGRFEDAFITHDSKAKEIFMQLEDVQQERYLNKINDIMGKYRSETEKLTLVNCALSLIDILHYISNEDLEVLALGMLGQYISSDMLEHLDKFDVEEFNLFPILENMAKKEPSQFSTPIYDKLISDAFDDELNEDLAEKFFKNSNIINSQILDQVDSAFAGVISAKNYLNTEFIEKCIKTNAWSENNISKPSKIVKSIIDNIDFDQTKKGAAFTELYNNIKDVITDTEDLKFYEQLVTVIDKCNESNSQLPATLVDQLADHPIESFDIASDKKQHIFASICESVKNSGSAQGTRILKLIVPMYHKIPRLPDLLILPDVYVQRAFSYYIKRVNATMLADLTTHSSYGEFLQMEKIAASILKRYEELGSNIPEIIQFFLKTRSNPTKYAILQIFDKMVSSRDKTKFNTLLTVAKENNSEFNSDLIEAICLICLKEAQDETNSLHHSLYEHAIELQPDQNSKTKISAYGTALIKNENHLTQDQGFSLLTKFNSKFEDEPEPAGVSDAIAVAYSLLHDNSERIHRYLSFIQQFERRLRFTQTKELVDLLETGLRSMAPENIINYIIKYLKQSHSNIVASVLNELMNFVLTTKYANAKKQCKQIFIANKDEIDDEGVQMIQEIYGEHVFE